jgi:hypothetical protein
LAYKAVQDYGTNIERNAVHGSDAPEPLPSKSLTSSQDSICCSGDL